MKDLHTPLQFLLVQFMNLCEDQVDYLVPIFFLIYEESNVGCALTKTFPLP